MPLTEQQIAQQAALDKRVAELATDPLRKIDEMAAELNVHKQTIFRSLRRLRINRQVGRPKQVR